MNRLKLTLYILLTAYLFGNNVHGDSGQPNLSIRPDAQPKTVDFFADALYWYTSETVDWAFTRTIEGISLESAYKTFSFNWAPGFRLGFGYNMLHDDWDTQASYTWFQSKAFGETSGLVTSAFLAARLSLLEPFKTGKASLHIHYNMFDWTLGRSFFTSKSLLFRPSIGLRGGWINQKILSTWTIPDFIGPLPLIANETIKQSFQGGGPTANARAKWCFGTLRKHFFYLSSEFVAGYLWGHWEIRDKFLDSLLTAIYVNTADRNFGSFLLRANLGLGWDANFDHERAHFELRLGYEIEDWLNQFQIFSDASGSQNNDLILQGLHLGLRFDF